jgi:hypothetical protein
MFSTHLVLISTNQTTVEHLSARDLKDREKVTLEEMYSFCAFRSVPFFFHLPLTPAPPFVPQRFLRKRSLIGSLFQGEAAYTTSMGCRVWTYRARGQYVVAWYHACKLGGGLWPAYMDMVP